MDIRSGVRNKRIIWALQRKDQYIQRQYGRRRLHLNKQFKKDQYSERSRLIKREQNNIAHSDYQKSKYDNFGVKINTEKGDCIKINNIKTT